MAAALEVWPQPAAAGRGAIGGGMWMPRLAAQLAGGSAPGN